MIAQMLPGFRDVRTPLITGYLWLVSGWILLGMPVPSGIETAGVLGAINSLTKFLSPAVSVIVLSFTAYLIGILGSPDADRFLHPDRGLVGMLERLGSDIAGSQYRFLLPPRMVDRLVQEKGSSSPALTHVAESALYARVAAEIAKHRPDKDFRPLLKRYGWADSDETQFDDGLAQLMHRDVIEEVLDPSAALLAADEKLYNNFDRTRSEADFRFCLTLPVFAIAVSTAWAVRETSWLFSAAIVVFGGMFSIGLVFKGWMKLHEATDIAVEAITAGVIKSRTLEQLQALKPRKTKEVWWRWRSTGK